MHYELRRDGYFVSTDPSLLNIEMVHAYLSNESYWSAGVTRERLEGAIASSLPFGAYKDGTQAAFARVITDYSTIAYIADVFVEEGHRGRGLGKLLMEAIVSHPDLQRMRRWLLGTRDAHGLYAQFGFTPLAEPDRWMERADALTYERDMAAAHTQAP
jgi:GNAT superfamily N-acetyltransferase